MNTFSLTNFNAKDPKCALLEFVMLLGNHKYYSVFIGATVLVYSDRPSVLCGPKKTRTLWNLLTVLVEKSHLYFRCRAQKPNPQKTTLSAFASSALFGQVFNSFQTEFLRDLRKISVYRTMYKLCSWGEWPSSILNINSLCHSCSILCWSKRKFWKEKRYNSVY